MSPPVLSHAVTPDGWPAPEFGYHGPAAGCPRYQVPGSGQPVYLLRTRASVLAALRNPAIRDLAAITPAHALAGVTLQRPSGLLRRTNPHDRAIRAILNPIWRRAACQPWRPALRHLARRQAAQALAAASPDGTLDLIPAFITPYINGLITLTAGPHLTAEQLTRLSDRTTGALLYTPAHHAPALAAWDELYAFTAGPAAEARAGRTRTPDSAVASALDAAGLPRSVPSPVHQSITALDRAGLPPGEADEAAATIYNGIPTTGPALIRITAQLLERPAVLAACQAGPAMAGRVVAEAMRRAAHFTFALPGVTRAPVTLDGTAIPAGGVVLPVIHAAEHDTARSPEPQRFDPARPRRATLAWGAGMHACLGRHLAAIALEEAVTAIAGMHIHPAPADPVTWRQGTMPVPAALPVRHTAGPPSLPPW